ncbi:2-alkyl-3-oxoalkanoate reductase [Parashewanella tropica]|uniref:2-alkyl-3-oxoalkanoate reductase n=1 Tax=Parashewanella tropica TaxID=2547970 RepID=UPI001FE4EEA7|nr:2-alkyl-3-oxoalkanoate reductase [Parashewanella tropica]
MIKLHELELQALEKLASKVSHVFVTGAGGFLGFAICQRLVTAGIKVTGFARGNYPKLEQLGVTMIQGDLAEPKAVTKAMQGCDMVFHVASKAGVWGSKESYFNPNVKGAENVIEACKANGIKYLVYTSTPSVTFDGQDENGIDESAPYAEHYMNFYGLSKSVAEKAVLEANNSDLKTVAIRPHLIWGPEDPHLVPRVLERGKAGRLKLVGKQDKLVDTIYIDNAAYSHILAALKLTDADSKCAGKAYFVSNDEPVTMANMLNQILGCAQLPPVTKRVPVGVAYAVGAILESVYKLLNKQEEPFMTRFVAKQLSCSHYYDIGAAKRDLGYQPIVTIAEGMELLKRSL